MEGAAELFDGVAFAGNALEAATGADVVCLVTHWPEFAEINLAEVQDVLNEARFVDLRNVFDPQTMKQNGWIYRSLGRPA